ncbi:MAG: Ig-like domain-containing protein, partial [Bdellovibrionota bacterium]
LWEDAAQAWMKAKLEKGENIFEFAKDVTFPPGLEIEYGAPPTENDDLHIETNKPAVAISEPLADTQLQSRFVRATAEASAPRGIARVEFYLDRVLLGTDPEAPFAVEASLKSFPNGFYTLRAIAYDDIDNSSETSVRVQLQSDESFVDIGWESPDQGAQISADDTTVGLRLRVTSADTIKQVTFFAVDLSSYEESLIEAVVAPSSTKIRATWTPFKAGRYRLYSKISVEGSGVLTGPSLEVEVMPKPESLGN